MAHNIIVEGMAAAIQPALATARYIKSSTKLELEKPHLLELDSEARPLDLSFQPEPDIDGKAPHTPYTIIGGDITITPPVEASTLTNSDIVRLKDTLSVAAESNLQKKEKLKLMRPKVTDALGHETHGDIFLEDLVKKKIMLIPMAIDPHGKFGPMLENFLFGYTPRKHLSFIHNRYYAAEMYARSLDVQCPHGILTTANVRWQREKVRPFFGHSYTAPTPSEYTLGKIGLSITKAFALHLRNTNKKIGQKPPKAVETPSPSLVLEASV